MNSHSQSPTSSTSGGILLVQPQMIGGLSAPGSSPRNNFLFPKHSSLDALTPFQVPGIINDVPVNMRGKFTKLSGVLFPAGFRFCEP